MVQINFAQKSVTVKIVYYGPGMSGKTTNLEVVHQRAPEGSRGDLTSISTDGDRTLFFDFMPLDLGTVAGMKTQFQIYTVPGQVYYNSTRKLVLQGVDGVIFVADSSASMLEENLESLRDLQENLAEYGKDLTTMPMVVQYNKRDMPDALPVGELERALNPSGRPCIEAVANTGQGVFPTLKGLAALVLQSIHEQTGCAGGQAAPAVPSPPPVSSTGSAEVAATPQMQVPTAAPEPIEAEAPPPLVMDAPPAVAASAEPVPQAPPPMKPPAPVASEMPTPQASTIPLDLSQTTAPALGAPSDFPPSVPQPTPDLSQTEVHPQMAQPIPGQPEQPVLSQAGVHMPSAQPVPQPAPPEAQAAPGLRIAQPVATAMPEPTVQTAPASTVGNVMQVPEGTTAAPPPATSRSLPLAGSPRIKPRQSALATPTQINGRKSAMITLVFVTVALAVGVAIGGLTFKLF